MERTQQFGFRIVKLEDRIAPSVTSGVLSGLSGIVPTVSANVGSASVSANVLGLASASVSTPSIGLSL
jgi:hypothetical protein